MLEGGSNHVGFRFPLSKVNKWSYLRRFKPSSRNVIVMYVNVSYSVNVRRPDSSIYLLFYSLRCSTLCC